MLPYSFIRLILILSVLCTAYKISFKNYRPRFRIGQQFKQLKDGLIERTRTRQIKNTGKSLESSPSCDAVDPARPSQLEEVAEETVSSRSGSVGSDSLYDLSLEKHQDPSPDESPSTKNRQVETDFERVPSSPGSDILVDPDDNSNASSLFYLVITDDESNDEETTPDSCPVSPEANLDTSSESSLFSVSKKLLPQQGKGQSLKHNDIIANSLSSNIVEVETNSTLDSPCLNTTAGKPKRKPATLPRRKVDNETPSATSSPSTGILSFATDSPIRKHCPKTMPKRSNSDGIPQVSSAPVMSPHKLDKEKPPVVPRKRSPSTEGVDTTTSTSAPVPKPRRKRNTVYTAPERGISKLSTTNQRSPELPKTQFSVFKKDFYASNVSWSAENSPVMGRKVHSDERTNMQQHLRPLSTCSGQLTTRNSKLIPKSASADYLKGEEGPLILPSATPAIEMAPFEEDWKERFTHHKRRSKTLKHPGMMRVRSQLIEVKGTMPHTAQIE